ncbi:quinone oxidoreductase family protein [Pseudomonas sp. S2_H01]
MAGSTPIAPPSAGEIQIRQHAIGVNFLDTYHRRGLIPIGTWPGIPGVEDAGEVVAVGPDVTGFAVGQRVAYGGMPTGSYVELRNCLARQVLRLPDSVSYEQAAAVTLKGLTAHMLMTRVAPLAAGQTVLVHAAAGGLGSIICQWANALGARVIGSVGSQEKAERAYHLGCESVILYKEESFVEGVRRLTAGKGVDVVYEGLGGEVFHQSLKCLRPFGHLIHLGRVADSLATVNIADLGPARSITVSIPGVSTYVRTHPDLQTAGDDIYNRVASGKLQVHIGGRYSLSDAAEAHRDLESGQTQGSVILLT